MIYHFRGDIPVRFYRHAKCVYYKVAQFGIEQFAIILNRPIPTEIIGIILVSGLAIFIGDAIARGFIAGSHREGRGDRGP